MPKSHHFQLGDLVQLIDSRDQGLITQIKGDILVLEMEEMEYEVHYSEVVLLSTRSPMPQASKEADLEEGIYVISEEEASWVHVHLLNHTSSHLHYIALEGNTNYLKDGLLEPFKVQKLRTLASSERSARFQMRLQLLTCYKHSPERNEFKEFVFCPSSGQKAKKQYIKVLGRECYVYETGMAKKASGGSSSGIPIHLKKHELRASSILIEEVEKVYDLHWEKLGMGSGGIDDKEKLWFQLKKADEFLDEAIRLGCRKVTFIHGGGKGRLKEALIERFREHPYVESIEQGDILRYGLGATTFQLKKK